MTTEAQPGARRGGAWGQAAIYAIGLGVSKSSGLLILPLVTHALTPAEFARLELLTSLITAGILLCSIWLIETLFRFASIPGEEGHRAGADIIGLGTVIALALLGLFLAFTPLIARALPLSPPPIEIALAGGVIAAESINSLALGWLRVQNRSRLWAVLMIGRAALHLALAALLLAGGFGVAGVVGASVLASLAVTAILAFVLLRDGVLRLAPSAWGPFLRYGAPLVLNGLAFFALNSADLWFLAGHVSPEDLARYALAFKLAIVAGLAAQPFELWWFPRRLAVMQEPGGAERAARLAGIGAGLSLLCWAGASIAGPLLILALTPPAYHGAIPIVPFLGAAMAIQGLGNLVNAGCYLGRSPATPGAVNIGAAAAAVILYLLLIPPWGLAGAVIATLVAQSLRTIAFAILSTRAAPLPYPFGRVGILALACTVTAALPQVIAAPLAGAAAASLALLGSALLARRLGLLPGGRGGRIVSKAG